MAADATQPEETQPLQLKTLTLLQALAQERYFDPPEPDGALSIHTLPHARRALSRWSNGRVRCATPQGLGNPSVLNALARKGLLLARRSGLPVLTAEGSTMTRGSPPTSCTATTIEARL